MPADMMVLLVKWLSTVLLVSILAKVEHLEQVVVATVMVTEDHLVSLESITSDFLNTNK
jgi:hypothetical protein